MDDLLAIACVHTKPLAKNMQLLDGSLEIISGNESLRIMAHSLRLPPLLSRRSISLSLSSAMSLIHDDQSELTCKVHQPTITRTSRKADLEDLDTKLGC